MLKRVTHIDPCRHYGFEIVEQDLVVGGGLMLSGGGYKLRELSPRATEVAVTTQYVSHKRPSWLWKPIEATVGHMFHRYLAVRNRARDRVELKCAPWLAFYQVTRRKTRSDRRNFP